MDNYSKLLASLLNLSASDIKSINVSEDSSNIFVSLVRNASFCPVCGSTSFKSLGYYSRSVTISSGTFDNANVTIKVPRYKCSDCHSSFSDSKRMTPKNKTISYKTILDVMELLKNPKMTFKYAAQLNGISESSVVRIFDSHCHITRSRFPEAICIDEVYTKNNDFKSKYCCIFYDFFKHTIIDIAPDRKKNYLHFYFQSIPKSELDNVKYVCIDLYKTYKIIAKTYFKKAIICADSFHVVKHLNDDLSKIRIRIMKSYDPDSIEYYLLKSWKSLLFDRTINLDNEGKMNRKIGYIVNYRQLLNLMLDISPELKTAYFLKEKYVIFNHTSTFEDAGAKLDEIINDFIEANIPEYEEFTGLLKNWRQEIINSFIVYKGRRINSSVAESINAIVSSLIYNTRGIRNHERRRKRIMYAVKKTGFTLK